MIDSSLPGADVIQQGLKDLASGTESIAALLVAIAAPSLESLDIPVPPFSIESPQIRLYRKLEAEHQLQAHSRYNAWRRRLVSFLRAARCES